MIKWDVSFDFSICSLFNEIDGDYFGDLKGDSDRVVAFETHVPTSAAAT